jgi:hypothetical protein
MLISSVEAADETDARTDTGQYLPGIGRESFGRAKDRQNFLRNWLRAWDLNTSKVTPASGFQDRCVLGG